MLLAAGKDFFYLVLIITSNIYRVNDQTASPYQETATPPHRARRVYGPAAAFAGYKNLATPLLAPFPFSFLFNSLTISASQRSVLVLHAHSALLPRILSLSARLP
jgi:hypothetical protein